MMPTIRDLAYLLRQGRLLALADETGWAVAADPTSDAAVTQLLQFQTETLWPTLVIDKVDQLGLYLVKVPELAWDLVEFAENPLTVVYGLGKNVSPVLLASQSETAIRRALSPDVQQLIGSFGKGLLTIPLETLSLPPAVEALVAEQFGRLPNSVQKPRVMRLGLNGEIEFIRK